MDTLPDHQSKSSSNVTPHRRENSRDSLVYFTTCMIGHLVEVHLQNGSVYGGIFHAADVEKDFGIVLKMASLIKDGTLRAHKSRSGFFRKPPYKTFIIPADELVQVVAENLSVFSDGMLNAVQSEKPVDLLTDPSISKSRHGNQGRDLIPWEPDEKVPPGLDNVFDETSIRGWDQFKVNESQFGVKSTFDEEQYTTKLSRSTRTRELEKKAQSIATEIEDEITRDVHVAEERGIQLNEKSGMDEETKYSAVRRDDEFDDSGFNEEDDKLVDACNDHTFGGSSTSSVQKSASSRGQKPASSSGKGYEDIRGDSQPSRNNINVDQSCSIPGDDARHVPSEQRSKEFSASGSSISESQLDEGRKNNSPEVSHSSRSAGESVSGHGDIKNDAKFGGGGTSASKIFMSAMDPLPAAQSKSNGSPRRREKSRDSLVYFTTCMIGHLVEVHLKNGSVYSGIFHAADVEKDFGIVLKMASLIKDGTLRAHKSRSGFFRKPPYKTFIIPADELVQVVAENLSVFSDGMLNAVQSEKPVDLLTDSSISKSRHGNQGRDLIPWESDEKVPPGLDNVFDESSIRGWDQFKVNESQFGVKSTFDEEQYTTKLSRSTRTKELEEKAQNIEREIEGENTRDVHVAEERGLQVNEKSDIDEETKYSAVRRVDELDDSGFNEEDDKLLDTCNDQTFGGSSTSSVQKSASSSGKGYEDIRGDSQPSRNNTNVDQSCSISGDDARPVPSEQRSKDFSASGSSISESQLDEGRKNNSPEVSHSSRSAGDSVSGHGDIKKDAKFGGGGTSAAKIFMSAMDPLPAAQSKSNGSPRRREKSRDSLVYFTTCMIGHLVEVHLKNGSVYSGIFHAADVEKDFGIVLKMASLIKDCTLRGHKSRSGFFRKPPFKTFIIPADELVQVVAEDLSLSSDDTLNAVQSEEPVELLTDSSISKSRHGNQGRELPPWEPDEIVSPCLDNVFDETSSGKCYEDGDSEPSPNNTNVDQSCSISGDDARHLPSEQRSKDYPAPGSSMSESQLGERRKNNSPEVSHSSRSAGESVSGHGGNQVTDIKEGAKFSGGGTSASKTLAEGERQVSQVSDKTKSESSFGQSDIRSSESRPAPSTPSLPGPLPSSEKPTLNPDAKEFKPSQQPAAVPAQSSMENTSFYCPVAPIQQMPGGYGIQPQYPGMFYYPGQQYDQTGYPQQMVYYTGQQYGQTGYPQYVYAQYPQQQHQPQMMMGQPPRPPPPYQPENP